MKELHLVIVSPERTIYDGKADSVVLPGELGSFQVLVNHAPIISSLQAGTLSYVTKEGEEHAEEVKGGFVEMNGNRVSVCVN